MNCPSCQSSVPEGSKFCQNCGAPIPQIPVQPAEPVQAPTAPEVPVTVIAPAQTGSSNAQQTSYSAGQSVPPQSAGDVNSEGSTDPKAIASLVCGIVSIFFLGLVLGIIAIALGSQVRKSAAVGTTSYKLATAGMIVGIVGLVGWALSLMIAGCTAAISL